MLLLLLTRKSGRLVIHILTTYALVFVLTLEKFKQFQFLSFPTHSKFTNFNCPWEQTRSENCPN